MVVNNKENTVKSIVQFRVKDFKIPLTKAFLDGITKAGLGNGVARDNYYVMNIDGVLRVPNPTPPVEFKILTKLLEACQAKGHTFLMLML